MPPPPTPLLLLLLWLSAVSSAPLLHITRTRPASPAPQYTAYLQGEPTVHYSQQTVYPGARTQTRSALLLQPAASHGTYNYGTTHVSHQPSSPQQIYASESAVSTAPQTTVYKYGTHVSHQPSSSQQIYASESAVSTAPQTTVYKYSTHVSNQPEPSSSQQIYASETGPHAPVSYGTRGASVSYVATQSYVANQPEVISPQQSYVANQPEVISAQQSYVANQPEVISPQQSYVTNQPEVISPQQSYVTNQPDVISPQQSYVTNQPEVVSTHQSYVTNQPEVISPQQSYVANQPEVISAQQSYVANQPEVISPQQSYVTNQPEVISPQQSYVTNQPEVHQSPSSSPQLGFSHQYAESSQPTFISDLSPQVSSSQQVSYSHNSVLGSSPIEAEVFEAPHPVNLPTEDSRLHVQPTLEPELTEAQLADLAHRFAHNPSGLFFGQIAHARSLMRNQELRAAEGLPELRIGSIRRGSPFWRP